VADRVCPSRAGDDRGEEEALEGDDAGVCEDGEEGAAPQYPEEGGVHAAASQRLESARRGAPPAVRVVFA